MGVGATQCPPWVRPSLPQALGTFTAQGCTSFLWSMFGVWLTWVWEGLALYLPSSKLTGEPQGLLLRATTSQRSFCRAVSSLLLHRGVTELPAAKPSSQPLPGGLTYHTHLAFMLPSRCAAAILWE